MGNVSLVKNGSMVLWSSLDRKTKRLMAPSSLSKWLRRHHLVVVPPFSPPHLFFLAVLPSTVRELAASMFGFVYF
jgi:hypothetical protein